MRGELFYDDFAAPWPEQRRLAVCMALGTAIVLSVLMLVEWPSPAALVRLIPPVLKVRLDHAPARGERAEARPSTPGEAAVQREEAPAPARPAEQPAAAVPQDRLEPIVVEQPATLPAESADDFGAAASGSAVTPAPVDWYAELERAAAVVGERAAVEPQSMHPEFDELRRIATLRYAEPKVNPPPETWVAEKDSYGRTLLKKGFLFQVLDDPRLINREMAQFLNGPVVLCFIPLGRRKPQNLPWVKTIRARYAYFLEPDELPPLKAIAAEGSADPR